MALVTFTNMGFYCAQADLYIDPMRKVKRAVITHAHSDHARPGMDHYLCQKDGVQILKLRLGKNISVQGLGYGDTIVINGVEVTLFPAGHVPGSAQVRLAYKGEIWVISGDYKTVGDGLTPAFEPVLCNHFVTESTFGLPIFNWLDQATVFKEINDWWRENANHERPSVLLGYSLGKAQRILKYLDRSVGNVVCHSTIAAANRVLEQSGFDFGSWVDAKVGLHSDSNDVASNQIKRSLVICPPAALDSKWIRPLGNFALANCSGWMAVGKSQQMGGIDRGFVLSDHADWGQLLGAVLATGAENIYVTHGFSEAFSRHLSSKLGLNSSVVRVNDTTERGVNA